jgi:hypothetical protein
MDHAGSVSSRRGRFVRENRLMSQATLLNTLVGRYGLHVIFGIMLALFAGFLYVFNYTSFF